MDKMKKFWIVILTSLLLLVSLSACSENKGQNGNFDDSKTYMLNQPVLELSVGESFALQVLDLTGTKVTWTSEQSHIASVDENGTVTAHAPGTAKIVAKFNGKTLECTVYADVALVPAYSLAITNVEPVNGVYTLRLMKGSEFTLETALVGCEENVTVTAMSNDSANVGVNGLTVSANGVTESAVITLSCEYQSKTYSVECTIIVEEVAA